MLLGLIIISFVLGVFISFLFDDNFAVGLVVFCISLILSLTFYDDLETKFEAKFGAQEFETETEEVDVESSEEESANNEESALSIIVIATFAVIGIVIFMSIVDSIMGLIHSSKFQLRKADEKLHKFCTKNHVSLDYKVETDIIRMAKDGVALYENLIHDISKYKTFSVLKTANTDSPEWMIWFFYVAQNNMVALNKDEMKSIAINYMSDLVALHKKYKDKYGVVDALNKLNEDCWTDLTSDDIRRIKNIVESYKGNKDIKAKCRIPFKTNSAELIEKYEK